MVRIRSFAVPDLRGTAVAIIHSALLDYCIDSTVSTLEKTLRDIETGL